MYGVLTPRGSRLKELDQEAISFRKVHTRNEAAEEGMFFQALGQASHSSLIRVAITYHKALVRRGDREEAKRVASEIQELLIQPLEAQPRLSGIELLLKDGLLQFLLSVKEHLPVPAAQIVKFKNVSCFIKREIVDHYETMLTQVVKMVAGPCMPKQLAQVDVLKNVSGYLMPGTLTLFLGPRGCGKSTLHRMLGGTLHLPGTSGEITYNGQSVEDIQVQRLAALVHETDFHLPFLSILETLETARNFTQSHDPTNLSPGLKALLSAALEKNQDPMLGLILHMMGLEKIMHHPAGSEEVPTTDANERHRLSSAEMLAGGYMVYYFNELNAGGVDESLTYELVGAMHMYCRVRRLTLAASLVQPSPEVFGLFDRIILLDNGSVIYQGHRLDAVAYFASIGYVKPTHLEVAEFLNEVAGPEGVQYLLPGFPQLDTEGFVRAYEASVFYRHTMRIVEDPNLSQEIFIKARQPLGLAFGAGPMVEAVDPTSSLTHPALECTAEVAAGDRVLAINGPDGELQLVAGEEPAAVARKLQANGSLARLQLERPFEPKLPLDEQYTRPYVKDVWTEIKQLTWRHFITTRRDGFAMVSRFITIVLLALFLGTLVWRASHDAHIEDIQLRRAIFFTTLMTLTIITLGQMPSYFQERIVFYKQEQAKFFRPFSYFVSLWAGGLPFSLFEGVMWAVIVYFLTGLSLRDGGWHFWIFLYVSIMMVLNAVSAIRLCAFFCPTFDSANGLFGVWLALMVMFAGNLMPYKRIPGYWIWFYYINPMQWAFTMLEVSEMSSTSYDQRCSTVGADLAPPLQAQYQATNFPFCIGRSGPGGLIPGPDNTIGHAWQAVSQFRSDYSWIGAGAAMLFAWQLIFNVLTYLAIAKVRHHPPITEGPDFANPASSENAGSKELKMLSIAPDVEEGGQQEDPALSRSRSPVDCTPVTLSWHNIHYQFTHPKSKQTHMTLSGVSGWAKPGELVAILGGPQTGKTTLLNVLACMHVDQLAVKGEVLVDGHPLEIKTFAHVSAYVERADSYFPFATVRESLEFSANLRMGRFYPPAQLKAAVEEALDTMEMRDVQHRQIKSLGTGISAERARNMAIAVELAANPSVLFSDEPTSGLDSRDALFTVTCLKKYARAGRTVIATLRNPSHRLLTSFDSCVILATGGQQVYFGEVGPDCGGIKNYFESIPASPYFPMDVNPATFIIDVVGNGVARSNNHRNYALEYRVSQLAERNAAELDHMLDHPREDGPVLLRTGYAAGYASQIYHLAVRFQQQYWRDVAYSFGRLMFAIVLGLLFGSLFWQAKIDDQNGTNARGGQIFEYTTLLGIFNAAGIVPQVAAALKAFKRERAVESYSVALFNLAWLLAEIPYLAVMVLVFCAIANSMAGLATNSVGQFFLFWFILFEDVLAITLLGMLLAAAIPFTPLASVLIPIIISIWIPTGGLVVQRIKIPSWYIWVYWSNPQAYAYNALMSTAFFCNYADNPACALPPGPPATSAPPGCPCPLQSDSGLYVWQAIKATRSLDHPRVPLDMVVLFLYCVLFYFLLGVALRFTKHNRN